jgi:maltodextrin utilization protein YvdJ
MHAIIMVVLMAVLYIVLCIELNTFIVVVGTILVGMHASSSYQSVQVRQENT